MEPHLRSESMKNVQADFAAAQLQEDPKIGKTMATSVLEIALSIDDPHLQGRALSLIADCDNLLSAHEAAFEQSTRAIELLNKVGDVGEEAKALAVFSYAASALGRNEQAIEAATLAMQLAEMIGDLPRLCEAYIQLGLSLVHAHCFDAAIEALHAARRLAEASNTPVNVLLSLILEGSCEVSRQICERHETGHLTSLSAIRDVYMRVEVFASIHDMEALAKPDQRPMQISWKLISSVMHSWLGNAERARMELTAAHEWLQQNPVAPWLDSLRELANFELAVHNEDWAAAEMSAAHVIELGTKTGREHASLLGHLLAFHALNSQGKSDLALVHIRKLAARERQIRAATVSSRSKVVAWQLEVRKAENVGRELKASAMHFERMTLEDPLTGIANRRCFEETASKAISGGQADKHPPYIALIDVDRFKSINDKFGHLIGDKVLKVIASLLESHVRADDLAARLAGDEFVLLLRCTEHQDSTDICERVSVAVRGYEWRTIAADLAVSISLGAVQAQRGESLEQVVHRSDQAMYAQKSQQRNDLFSRADIIQR